MSHLHGDTDNRTRSLPQGMTLRVGPGGDIEGSDDRVLQAGIDYLARLGGPGTLQILPGDYQMANALFLHSGITVRGAGMDTVLHKLPSHVTRISRETDWYENRITVEEPDGFHPGSGIMLRSYNDQGTIREVVRDTVVGVEGNEIYLSRRPEKNFWCVDDATAATLYPLLTAAEGVDDVIVEDLVLDGHRDDNDEINGNYAGAVFLQQCHRYLFRRVTARHYHGDGFSFQICDDIHFDACQSLGNANLGFHPGSGSQRPIFRDCTANGNSQGIFFCWGVTDGRVEAGEFCDNTDYGISIGHRDTDNSVRGATLHGNHKTGLRFREPAHGYRGGHRNVIEDCQFSDNGFAEDGVGIDIRGLTHDTTIRNCRFEGSTQGQGPSRQKIGIRIGVEARSTHLAGNHYHDLAQDVVDLTGDSAT
ncbi:MAG: right-handed parallel beta-helix repeat-containing protein [Gemmatimonadetes bacterium]|jgi:hypothetical protein|nr:right-handed parallel beta-helix repeat-containing protein [Gemmatimonadota bacterium]MBT6145395.1 right-handed parallel beta-helix repeat-containing protein [Gemmatimonadota bacterium]MBT7861380.1 right-handed parallel beta-helix repeat-containing protein [Gemmatimonadota bacterium]